MSTKQYEESRKVIRLDMYIKEVEDSRISNTKHEELKKLYCFAPSDITKIIALFRKQRLWTYEADVSKKDKIARRFLIDNGIKSGVDITNGEITPIDLDCPLRKWYLDVETLSKLQSSVNAYRDEPICIISFYDNYNGKKYSLILKKEGWDPKPHSKNHCIIVLETEKELLLKFIDLVKELDPDIFIGWNLVRYDFTKIFSRLRKHKIDPAELSPLGYVDTQRFPYTIAGRILFDLMTAYIKFTNKELRSYTLAYVSKYEELIEEHLGFKGTTYDIWEKDPDYLLTKNLEDVEITRKLDEKYDLVDFFDTIRKEFGCLFSEVLSSSRVIDTALLRLAYGRVALPTVKKAERGERYLGAIIFEPEAKHYHNACQIDSSRAYPRIVKAFNISPEKYRGEKGYYKIPTADGGGVISFTRGRLGLIPSLIDYFFKLRDAAEVGMNKEYKNKDRFRYWKRRMEIYKAMSNAVYGVMGYENFRLYFEPCARAVPLAQRTVVLKMKETAESLGYTMLYGDTDSVFIQLKETDPEKMLKEAQDLTARLNEVLLSFSRTVYKLKGQPFIVAMKRIYSNLLIMTKKRYGGKYIWDEKKGWHTDYELKGIEAVRTDSSELEEEVQTKIIEMILSDDPAEELLEYWQTIEKNILSKYYPPMYVSYPSQLTKKFTSYKTVPGHVAAAVYTNQNLNTDYTRGDKPRRLPIDADLLFGYPRNFTFRDKERTVKGISLDEYTTVPEAFFKAIDWRHVYTRLRKKVEDLFLKTGIEISPTKLKKKKRKKSSRKKRKMTYKDEQSQKLLEAYW